jgi:hypothetical protein
MGGSFRAIINRAFMFSLRIGQQSKKKFGMLWRLTLNFSKKVI